MKKLEIWKGREQGLGQALWDRSRALLQVGLYQLVDTRERFVTCSTVCFDCQVLQLQCICALKLYRFNGLPNACLYHSFIDINGATRSPDEISLPMWGQLSVYSEIPVYIIPLYACVNFSRILGSSLRFIQLKKKQWVLMRHRLVYSTNLAHEL